MKPRYLNNERGFLSDYFLGSVLARGGRSSGLTDRASDAVLWRFSRLRERAEARGRDLDAAACRERFLRPLLRDILGFHLGEGEERIHPLYAAEPDQREGKPPLLLVYCGGWDEDISEGKGASPVVRLEKALAAKNLRHGLLITGERLRLVRAAGDGPKGAHLEADLAGMSEDADPGSFGLFLRLFHASAFVPSASGKAPIDEIEEESRQHAEKVSEDLKGAVFAAAEKLTGAILAAVPEGDLRLCRDAALTTLYRVLFILYAEARDARLQQHRLYQDAYSVEGLVRLLFEEPARAWAANSCGLWERLRAAFRIYDQGLPKTDRWDNIPARGGKFFSALTAEGKLLESVRLPDSVVSYVILNLAATVPRYGVGLERVSFAELDIESLGAVYEGLLEYEPKIAQETLLEVRVKGEEYALPPAEVARLCRELHLALKDPEVLSAGTEAASLVSEDSAEGGSAVVVRRLEPGGFFFVPGAGRKGSGSFYTPLPLVRDLIEHALGPFARGKTVTEIEALRVLDPACGSAHFLVEAMRFLGQELHRAYVAEFKGKAPPAFTHGEWDGDWKASDEAARVANSEARAWCKRRIAERCLFGVDYNPTAASLARVALWIESLAGDRPLSYFDHHVRCGNALLGTWLERLDRAPHSDLEDVNLAQDDLFSASARYIEQARKDIHEAAKTRRLIDAPAGFDPDSIEELAHKRRLKHEGDDILQDARLLFDLRSASAFIPTIWADWSNLCQRMGSRGVLKEYAEKQTWWGKFLEVRARERFFHWEIEFPDVLLDDKRPGFDVVLGNPPWDKILPDRIEFYGAHDVLLSVFVGGELDTRIKELEKAHPGLDKEFERYEERLSVLTDALKRDYQWQERKIGGRISGGHPDLFKFFVERGHRLLAPGGRAGLVLPAAIYNNEGATGLRYLLLDEARVERFYCFENREKIFPIHSSYKFVNLVFSKAAPDGKSFTAAFMRQNIAELSQEGPKPWLVPVSRSELGRLSPGTLAFLEFRSPRDREILLKFYDGGKPLGESGSGTWNARLWQQFNTTSDRGLWTDKGGKLHNPRRILGRIDGTTEESPHYAVEAWPEIRARMEEKGFWPLYSGVNVDPMRVHHEGITRWVSLEAHEREFCRAPKLGRKLVYRRMARNTDERTCIAAVLPEKSCFGDTLFGVEVPDVELNAMAAVLNSLAFDFGLRLRIAGSNLSYTYLERAAVPRPGTFSTALVPDLRLDRASIYDDRKCWNAVWESNRSIVDAYGLDASDFEYIISSFPLFAKKHPEFHTYLMSRLVEWKADAPQSVRKRSKVV